VDTPNRRRIIAATVAITLIPIGVGWRMLPLHLPFFAYKYGGSILWAAMVFFILAAIAPRLSPAKLATAAAVVAAAVEFSRLLHTPALDAFRDTLAGKLILGRFFSPRNIVAYWLAIAVSAAIDAKVLHRHRSG
jgi:hypothetical protein